MMMMMVVVRMMILMIDWRQQTTLPVVEIRTLLLVNDLEDDGWCGTTVGTSSTSIPGVTLRLINPLLGNKVWAIAMADPEPASNRTFNFNLGQGIFFLNSKFTPPAVEDRPDGIASLARLKHIISPPHPANQNDITVRICVLQGKELNLLGFNTSHSPLPWLGRKRKLTKPRPSTLDSGRNNQLKLATVELRD